MNKIILALLISLFSTSLLAKSYSCIVTLKLDSENVYTQEMMDKYKYEVKINDNESTAILSRCSFESSANAVTCDEYNVDKIERDSNVGISKYYYFRGQFDVQLFSNLTFVENNGRGSIAFGKCILD